MDLEIHQMDVVTAFFVNKLGEEIYMEQPDGFVFGDDMVCKLQKSIYGLKQSPRLWNKRLDEHLRKLGLDQTESDHCVYINKSTGIILTMWVDDILIQCSELRTMSVQTLATDHFGPCSCPVQTFSKMPRLHPDGPLAMLQRRPFLIW